MNETEIEEFELGIVVKRLTKEIPSMEKELQKTQKKAALIKELIPLNILNRELKVIWHYRNEALFPQLTFFIVLSAIFLYKGASIFGVMMLVTMGFVFVLASSFVEFESVGDGYLLRKAEYLLSEEQRLKEKISKAKKRLKELEQQNTL